MQIFNVKNLSIIVYLYNIITLYVKCLQSIKKEKNKDVLKVVLKVVFESCVLLRL